MRKNHFRPLLMRSCCLTLLTALFWCWPVVPGYAQLGTLSTVSQPVAPDAAALGKYVDMPVSNYSGLADISIPLYSYRANKLSFPISLSYHSSGIRVRDIPGTVGAGFSLQAGGVITRVVRGITDGNDLTHPGVYKENLGTLGSPGSPDYPDYRMMPGVTSAVYVGDNNKIDTEFDVFYYNFMGYSGRFTYNKFGEIVMLGVTNLKPIPGGFVFMDAEGVTYHFDVLEATPNSVIPTTRSWYLSRIYHPVTHENIYLTYKTIGPNIYRTAYGKGSRFDKIRYQDASGHLFGVPDQTLNPICDPQYSGGAVDDEISNTGGIMIDQMVCGHDTVKFYHDTSRADVYKIKLDSIRVLQAGNVVQRIRFAYTYNKLSGNPLDKKLLLSGLTINDEQPYAFSYYQSYQGKTMPGMFAKGEDFWGFYNGEDFPEKPDGTDGAPRFKVLIPGQSYTGWNSGHRNPDYRYGQLGSLSSITYPTGGRTELEYEGNDFSEGFTGGRPEDDISVALQLDSVRSNGLIGGTNAGDYYPSGYLKSKEIMVHENQTATVSTTLGLSAQVNTLTAYMDQIYNSGDGYECRIKLYKYNTGSGVFDLVEQHAYNPVALMGAPADGPAFIAARNAYGTTTETHTLALTEGRYKIEAEIDLDAYGLTAQMNLTTSFKYRRYAAGSGDGTSYIYNAGGIRIKKIRFISPVNSSGYEKTYTYNDGPKSSGWLVSPFANVSSSMYWGEMRYGGSVCPQLCNFYEFHYDNLIPLGNAHGGVIGYTKVTEAMIDGRKKTRYYSMAVDGYNTGYLGYVPIIDRLIEDNSDFRGLLLYEEQTGSGNQKVQTVSRSYSSGRVTATQNMYALLTDIVVANCDRSFPFFNNFGQWWGGYAHTQSKVVLLQETVKDFNGTDSLTHTTKHQYAYWNSTQPSSTSVISSDGDSTVTVFKYPYDFNTGVYGELSVLNVIGTPVETYVRKYQGGVPKVTGAELVSFRSNVYAPDTVFRIQNPSGLSDFVPASPLAGVGLTRDSRYRAELTFHSFNHGNVVEQTGTDRVKEVLLWGYGHRYIVARVRGSDYATVKSLVDTTIVNNPASDAALRGTLNNIRSSLASSNPEARVTTYTYDPLKGMSSMTDPRGELTLYTYDPYGKLKFGKDADGSVKQRVNYHYKP